MIASIWDYVHIRSHFTGLFLNTKDLASKPLLQVCRDLVAWLSMSCITTYKPDQEILYNASYILSLLHPCEFQRTDVSVTKVFQSHQLVEPQNTHAKVWLNQTTHVCKSVCDYAIKIVMSFLQSEHQNLKNIYWDILEFKTIQFCTIQDASALEGTRAMHISQSNKPLRVGGLFLIKI